MLSTDQQAFLQLSQPHASAAQLAIAGCSLKSERQQPDHYLRRKEVDSIKAHGGSPTRRSPHPPKAGAYTARSNPPNTAFRRFYERGDLPIAVEHRGMKNVISWKVGHINMFLQSIHGFSDFAVLWICPDASTKSAFACATCFANNSACCHLCQFACAALHDHCCMSA